MAVRCCARVAPSPRRVQGEEEAQGRSVSGRAGGEEGGQEGGQSGGHPCSECESVKNQK